MLVNSNPATIMTDPELADRTYVEPLTVEVLDQRSSSASGPTRSCPRWAGRPRSTWRSSCAKAGVLAKYGVKLIGAQVEAIEKAEDRELFKQAMEKIGLEVPRSGYAHSLEEALAMQATCAELPATR